LINHSDTTVTTVFKPNFIPITEPMHVNVGAEEGLDFRFAFSIYDSQYTTNLPKDLEDIGRLVAYKQTIDWT
jgi:hypothetical protein